MTTRDFAWYVTNAATGPTRRKNWNAPFSRGDVNWNPHCDDKVLHAPGDCEVCDLFPEAQMLRVQWAINFTGEHEPGLTECPAERARPLTTINRWGGNVPSSGDPLLALDDLYASGHTSEDIDLAIESLKRMKEDLRERD